MLEQRVDSHLSKCNIKFRVIGIRKSTFDVGETEYLTIHG